MPAKNLEPSNELPSVGITLRGGNLSFADKPIFKDLDLDLPAGRTTCLLGHPVWESHPCCV